jgi:hypothetical protein
MLFTYVKTKEALPKDTQIECPICFQDIDIDENVEGVPNCVICIRGHRMHNICFAKCQKHECPCCRSIDIKFCKSIFGYAYVERK